MKVSTTHARHLLMRLRRGDSLPDALLRELRDEVVLCGWLRASGVLSDVELSAFDGAGMGAARKLSGPVHVVSMEGSVGLSEGDVSCSMRVVLARETDNGVETLAGELVRARIEALEVLVTAFDDVAATRRPDAGTTTWLIDELSSTGSTAVVVDKPRTSDVAPAPSAIPEARASDLAPRAAGSQPSLTPTLTTSAMPPKPVRPPMPDLDDEPFPDAGDFVEHFHFGRCEVIKSDGDRLHLRLGKEGRIKEIALEMLKVTRLDTPEGEPAVYRLDRKL
ncbi:MAG: DNA-binding protein [Myxococcales bacterium]|nr:DNA-binding protein [Myxococcales bacterium]